VDVYGASAETTSWNVARGIQEAVNNGANVINLSLGGSGDSLVLRDLVKSVTALGIPIFAAAGNEPVTTPFFPAAYPEVTAVTARGQQPSATGQVTIAPYANFGSFVDVAAPDASVIYFADRPWYVRGTSAAAAYTSGMAAGLAETTRQNWTEVRNILQRNFPVP
jgi:serine protease